MSKVWRFTGPPENWITALRLNKWAFNEHKKNVWKSLASGDIILLHSTKKSDFSKDTVSSIIGIAFVSENTYKKDELWWVQEIESGTNMWPYVIPLKETYIFSDIEGIDLTRTISQKSRDEIHGEIEILMNKSISINDLNLSAKYLDSSFPQFPVNGSASGVNKVYQDLILNKSIESGGDLYKVSDDQEINYLEDKVSLTLDEKLSMTPYDMVLRDALDYTQTYSVHYTTSDTPRRYRKESTLQKKRVAKIEDYRCQICGFKCDFELPNGKKVWVYEVDHIIPKKESGNEEISNLILLCPNCHAKKTKGVIEIDPNQKTVTELGQTIDIKDNHLTIK